MSPGHIAVLAVAGLLAGAVNALAGGGSLITFPTLLAVGYPALAANVTNTVAVWPGYLGSTAGYRSELAGQRTRVIALTPTSVVGAGAGVAALLLAPPSLFRIIVPYLILLSCLLLAVQPRLASWVSRLPGAKGGHRSALLHGATLAAGAYGAYFGGGLGVMLLGVLALFLADALQRLNALKSLLSLVINTVALVAFVIFAPVAWLAVAIIAPTSLIGGYAGARVVRRLDARILRGVVVVFGVAVGAYLLAK